MDLYYDSNVRVLLLLVDLRLPRPTDGTGRRATAAMASTSAFHFHFFWGIKYVSNVRDFTLITSFFYPTCRVVHLARRRSCRVELLENYERELTISGASMNLTAPTPKPSWS